MKDRQQPPFTPGDWKRSRARKRPDAAAILLALVAFAAVAGVAYFLWQDLNRAPQDGDTASEATSAVPGPEAPQRPERGGERGDRILSCTGPDGRVFYTNAATCEAADLDNRVNVLPAREDVAAAPAGRCLSEQGEVAHQFLPACQQQFREALEVERFLARAPDPVESRRAQEYCDLIAQGVSNGCLATSEIFCYLHVCQQLVERRP